MNAPVAIITDVNRALVLFAAALAVVGVGCNRAPDDKEAVKAGVVEHLQKNAALDMNQLSVDVGDVKFEGNRAVAQVSIKPKTAPDQGMSMSYTLERRGDKWMVQGRGAGHGGMGMGGGAGMGGGMGMGKGGDSGAGAAAPKGADGGDLPAGHPPVNQTPAPAGK